MIGLLGIISLFLLFVIIFQIARTSELTSLIKGDPDNHIDSSRINALLLMLFLIFGFVGIVYSAFIFLPKMLPEAASEHGIQTDRLFNITLLFTGIVFIITHIVLFWFTYRYREREGQKPYFYPHNNKLEVIWTLIPAIVMTVLVVMGLRTWFNIFPSADEMPEELMVVEITAKQFGWMPRYAGMDGKFGPRLIDTAHVSPLNELGIIWDSTSSHDDIFPKELHFIKDQPVLMKLGALDVLHSFYLPHFRVKMDCVPGIPTKFYFVPTKTTKEMQEELSKKKEWQKIDPETGEPKWKNFKYELACTELCGKSHYAMQMDVIVETEEEFRAWAESQTPYYDLVIKPNLGDKSVPKIETETIGSLEGEESEQTEASASM